MRLSFSETMRGTVRRNGHDHPIEFTVTARAEGLGYFTLGGTCEAEPFTTGPVRGSLQLKLIGFNRFIRYRLSLPGGFRLEAEKKPSLLQPLRSMTWMPVKLLDRDGALVAEGEMTFALRELPAFVFSALPVGR